MDYNKFTIKSSVLERISDLEKKYVLNLHYTRLKEIAKMDCISVFYLSISMG